MMAGCSHACIDRTSGHEEQRACQAYEERGFSRSGNPLFESLAFPSFPDDPVLEQCRNAPCGITGTKGMALLVFLLRLVLALAGGNV